MSRPSMFIGSSSEGKTIAQCVRSQLADDADVTIWNEGPFGLGQGTLESLVTALDQFDFAVLVLTPDDMVESRENTMDSW
jgi:predicted nucleotide-binding protein